MNNYKKETISFTDFIGHNQNIYKFLHNTMEEETAIKIIEYGFQYACRLSYTTDLLSNVDDVEANYFLYKRKHYGNFTIIIHININLYKFYYNILGSKLEPEFALSAYTSEKNEDEEQIWNLHRQFIKGYYNQKTKEGIHSPYYNPENNLPEFEDNIQHLKIINFKF
jgi:hypothetical protein